MFSSVGSWTPKLTTITAAQMTAINANMQLAHDAIGGGTYTPITITEWTGTVGAKYNFSATGLQIAGLGGLHVLSGSTAYVNSGGFLTVSSGGIATISNGASLNLANGSEQVVQSGAILNVASGGTMNVSTGGFLTVAPGSTTDFQETVSLTMSQPTSSADVGANKLYSTNTVKAWAKIATDGVGGVTVSDGCNIASIAIDATDITVTFAHAFANGNYASTAGAATLGVLANAHTPTTTTLKIRQYDTIGTVTVSPLTNSTLVSIQVIGRQ